jgi:hypothetical protein
MPSIVWKGQLTFGLVSIPVKLYRAARRERVRMHYVHRHEITEEADEQGTSPPEVATRSAEPALQRIEAYRQEMKPIGSQSPSRQRQSAASIKPW